MNCFNMNCFHVNCFSDCSGSLWIYDGFPVECGWLEQKVFVFVRVIVYDRREEMSISGQSQALARGIPRTAGA